MNDADLRAIGERRRLIFSNVANGVHDENIMAAFKVSREEVLREAAFVARKIREYRFRRGLPPIDCDTPTEIRFNRLALLETLSKIGNMSLSSSFIIPNVKIQKLDSMSVMDEATHRLRNSHNG